MALRDRIMDSLGVVPAAIVEELRETATSQRAFAEEASELAWYALNAARQHEDEHDETNERRSRLLRNARRALESDPHAGAEAEHFANFAFGRGVPKPEAKAPRVQAIIDEVWTNPGVEESLTSFDAQRALSHELKSGANIFVLAVARGGRLTTSLIDASRVRDVVKDPENEQRVLYYVVDTYPRREWDFAKDAVRVTGEGAAITQMTTTYFAHWRNVEVAEAERRAPGGARLQPVPRPPQGKLGAGVVYHLRTNRRASQTFGVSPWKRSLRFYSALNEIVTARVSMAKAASSLIARRVANGTPQQVRRSAQSILQQTGEIGSTIPPAGFARPPQAGSIWTENESSRIEPLSLNSGSSNAAQDASMIRGAAIAPSAFGQHFFGDASNANLATATSLELPALMAVSAWQETFEGLYRWLCTYAIEQAVRAGRLGGNLRPSGGRALGELRLTEAAHVAEAEERTGTDLSFSFTMPYPGRRNLPDVTNAVVTVASAFGASNEPLARELLLFLFTHGFQSEDPPAVVKGILDAAKAEQAQAEPGPAAVIGPDPAQSSGTPAPVVMPRDGRPERADVPNVRQGRTEPPGSVAEETWDAVIEAAFVSEFGSTV